MKLGPMRYRLAFGMLAILFAPALANFATTTDAAAALPAGLSCHARDGRDLSGDAAYVWGMNNIVGSAAECCALCAAHQMKCGTGERPAAEYAPGKKCGRGRGRCNAWVFCSGSTEPGAEDRCFSYECGGETQTRAAPGPFWMASLSFTLTNRRPVSGSAHSKPAL